MTRLFAAVLCALLGACATIDSRTAQGGGVGLAYMAPMRFLTVNATRAAPVEAVALTAARNAAFAAETEHRAAQAALKAAHDEAVAARTLADATTGAAHEERETAALNKEADERVAQQRARIAETAYTRTQETLTRLIANTTTPPNSLRETVEVTMGAAVGDPNARFVARITDNMFRSARGRIVVGQNGLLQSANIVADGQVDEIVVGIAESLVALQGGARGVNILETSRATPQCSRTGDLNVALTGAPAPTALSITFDPVNQTDIEMVNHALCEAGFSYRLRVAGLGQRTLFTHASAPDAGASEAARLQAAYDAGVASERAQREAAEQRVSAAASLQTSINDLCPDVAGRSTARACNGLVYRQNQPMHVDIIRYDTANMGPAYVERSFNFSVPNSSPVDVLPYGDAVFVTRRNDVGFVDGSLVSLDFDHPSEMAVAAGVPFRALQAASNALSQVLQLRVNLENKEAELTRAIEAAETARSNTDPNAQITNLQNQQRILELQIQVEQARQRLRDAEAETVGAPD